MTERRRTNEDTLERLRSDPWLEAFVASKRRRPFAHQRARDLAAVLAARDAEPSDDGSPAGSDDDETLEVVCGHGGGAVCASAD